MPSPRVLGQVSTTAGQLQSAPQTAADADDSAVVGARWLRIMQYAFMVSDGLFAGSEFVDDLISGAHPELLQTYFDERILQWRASSQHFDDFPLGLFDDLTSELPRPVAFDLLTPATGLALKRRQADVFAHAVELLVDLAWASDTTEMPPALSAAWADLRSTVEGSKAREQPEWESLCFTWEELRRFYRRG